MIFAPEASESPKINLMLLDPEEAKMAAKAGRWDREKPSLLWLYVSHSVVSDSLQLHGL